MSLPFLVSIHGIRTCGDWQEQIAPILRPHFRYIGIKYSHYRTFGGLKLVFDPPSLLVGIAITLVVLLLGQPIVAGLVAATVFVISFVKNRVRIDKAEKHFRDEVEKYCGTPPPFHVIAHSLGTRIIMNAVASQPTLRYNRVLLTGCVLPRNLPWEELRANGRNAVAHVRNEMGGRDMVSKLAAVAPQWLLPHLGDAGYRGFTTRAGVVHELNGHHEVCGCPAFVHNAPGPFPHSGMFENRRHVLYSWLPWFLGLDIMEFGRFVDECIAIANLEQSGTYPPTALTVADELGWSTWSWTNNRMLRDALRNEITQLQGIPESKAGDFVGRAILMMCSAVATSLEELRLYAPDEKVLTALDPRKALQRAAKEVGA
jgi:pimeloyl-ACP methyl ester carboxylesterase